MSDSEDRVSQGVNEPGLLKAVMALLQSPTYSDKKRILTDRPELMSDAALDLLAQIEAVHNDSGNSVIAGAISAVGDIVKRAMSHGVDFALLQELVFEAIVKAPKNRGEVAAYFKVVADRFPELLKPVAVQVLDVLKAEDPDGSKTSLFYNPMRRGIGRSRSALPATDPRTALVVVSNLLYEYQRNGGLDSLDRAILYAKSAIAHGGEIPLFLDRLGIAYKLRYYLTDETDALDFAVECHRRVHEIGPVNDPQRPMYEDHYALALRAQYNAGGDPALLNASIAISESLVGYDWPDAERAVAIDNLASSLELRYDDRGNIKDLELAIEHYKRALSLDPDPESRARTAANAAAAMLKLGLINTDKRILHDARAMFKKADAETSSMAYPRFSLGRIWASIAFRGRAFADAANGYAVALDAVRQLVFISERDDASRRHWLRDFQSLVPKGAYALAKLGRKEEAVVALESSLNLLTARRRLQSGVPSASSASTRRLLPTIDQIYRRIPSGVTVCYTLCTSAGGLVLLVADGIIDIKWLPSANSASLDNLLFGENPEFTTRQGRKIFDLSEAEGYLGAQVRWQRDLDVGISDPDVEAEWTRALGSILEWLWHHMLREVHTALEDRNVMSVLIIPVGRLAGLPFHAACSDVTHDAGNPIQWFGDSFNVAYVPSIMSLTPDLPSKRKSQSAVVVADIGALKFAGFEAENVVAVVGSGTVVRDPTDDWSALPSLMASSQLWHFACHSHVDSFSKEVGSLVMPGGARLRVDQIAGSVTIGPALVVLSACATGAPEKELLTENISLASDFISIGAREVVATAWPVNDAITCLFMLYFYRVLPQTGWKASTAMRLTQRWMRTSTLDAKIAFMKTLPDSSDRQSLAMQISSDSKNSLVWFAAFFVVAGDLQSGA